MHENYKEEDNILENNPEESGPETLKSHDRVASTAEELNLLITEYTNKGWEVAEQNEEHAKLTKDVDAVESPTSNMASAVLTLEVNIKLENKE